MPDPTPRRRTFGPVVLLGLATTGLGAVAGSKPWAGSSGSSADRVVVAAAALDAGQVPAANALALVGLACWGVVLVTRGRVRRVVAGLAVLAAVGVGVAVAVGSGSAPDGVRDAYGRLGASDVDAGLTAWFWIAALLAVGSLVAAVLAVRLAPDWPQMGSRYDAPGGASDPSNPPDPPPVEEEQSSLDLWKAMDEGRDPTVDPQARP